MRFIAAFLFSMIHCLSSVGADEGEAKARLAKIMVSAFECSTLSIIKGDEQQSQRLFDVGFRAGREFFEAFKKNQISKEVVQNHVPLVVVLKMEGPSADFIIGRIYEDVKSETYDTVIKRDANGLLMPIEKWRNDEPVQRGVAGSKYRSSNCDLIR